LSSSADLNVRAGRFSRSSQYTGVDDGMKPPRLMLRRSVPSISAAVRASRIAIPGLSMAATTSAAVAIHAGSGFGVKGAGGGL
jgi:hypothetical protein